MHIAFVYPRFEKFLSENPELEDGLTDYFLGDFTTPPSLGIPILAALTPENIDVTLLDDNAGDKIDFSAEYDLVAINCFTPQATRAFEIGDGFRNRGKKVVMGGFFPSFMVEECLKHSDSVNVGEGEPNWLDIINDARKGTLKPVYKAKRYINMKDIPIPDRKLFYKNEFYDWEEDLVQVTRGCVYNCAMCAIPEHMGHKMRFRPVEMVVEEIKSLKYENVYLADDALFFPQKRILEYSRKLFEALIPLKKKYFVSSTAALNTDTWLMDLAAKAGVKNFYCTMNVDPVSIRALQGDRKAVQQIIDLVNICRDRDMRFFGSCALGRDWDDNNIADRILTLFDKANINTSEFFLFTPYPGSPQWGRMERQNRIMDREWKHYNGAHVVCRPAMMSADELYGQFVDVWNGFYKMQRGRQLINLEPSTFQDGREIVGKPLQEKGIRGESVITGIGVVSPLGSSHREITERLREGKKGLKPISKFDASYFRANNAGEIECFDPSHYLSREELDVFEDDYLRYAVASARMALEDAGIGRSKEEGGPVKDMAMVLATCNGGLLSGEEEYKWKHGKSEKPFNEKMNLQAQYYGFGKAMSKALGIAGEAWVVTTACSSTTAAIGLARTLIKKGYYKKVLVGGSDSLSLANLAGFDGLKATSAGYVAPFSLPVGLNVGEASCFWVMEEMESVILRKARCYGKITGDATNSDAYHPTAPDPGGDGIFRVVSAALENSGMKISDMGCVNAHGTGTESNDRAECRGMSKLIGDNKVPVVSTKSFFGHCMGSTGILEATCNLFAMNSGFIPPTINFSEPRPGCSLDNVPNRAREKDYRMFVSVNSAFGGNNASVVVSRLDADINAQQKKDERVVITGAGAVSSLGLNMRENLDSLHGKMRGIKAAKRVVSAGLKSRMAGLVREFGERDISRRLDFSGLSNRISRYAVSACWNALSEAKLKINRRNCEKTGVAFGICNGSPETEHMDKVFSTDNYEADVTCFSNITANSVAGWVSNLLTLKGTNITLSPGPHAGLQALAYAFDSLSRGRGNCMIAAAADEVYRQSYYNYDLIGFLCRDEHEEDYMLRMENRREKVIGEGASALVLERLEDARNREADVLGEILGYGMNMDCGEFTGQNLNPDGLISACMKAFDRSGVSRDEIGLIVWGPQGNCQDMKVLEACDHIFGVDCDIPFAASSFNSGYIESASALLSLGAALVSLRSGEGIWPQITGVGEIDSRKFEGECRNVLVCASSDVGYNYAVVVKCNV